jgi:hypothetical protein
LAAGQPGDAIAGRPTSVRLRTRCDGEVARHQAKHVTTLKEDFYVRQP